MSEEQVLDQIQRLKKEIIELKENFDRRAEMLKRSFQIQVNRDAKNIEYKDVEWDIAKFVKAMNEAKEKIEANKNEILRLAGNTKSKRIINFVQKEISSL